MSERHEQPGRSQTAVFSLRVKEVMRPRSEVLATRPGTSCAEMVAMLAAERAGCAVVVDAMGRPLGIITERDIALKIAFQVSPDTPVEAVMTAPVMTVRRREYLYHAIAWMRRHNHMHMPVVDVRGRLVGLIYLHDALAAASARLMRQIDRLTHEGTVDRLKDVKTAQIDLAEELLADNLPAIEVLKLITRINADIYRQVGEAALKDMAANGWGQVPVPATTIVMGSAGRGENYLFPDQDNGFIISDYPDDQHTQIDAFFRELAERVCRDLHAVGIPYCNGYCMAVNPLWRKTLSQWIAQIRMWTRKGNVVAIRLADIFFDFQPVWGDNDLASELRHAVTGLVRNNPSFLRLMFQETSEHAVALGIFGRFATERDSKEHRGQVNLKYAGTLPLVEAVRLLALREGVEETATLDRIRVLADAGVFSLGEREDLSAALSLVSDILLRRQIADFRAGRKVGYFVDPAPLGRRQRGELIAALKAIEQLRRRVDLEFTAQIF